MTEDPKQPDMEPIDTPEPGRFEPGGTDDDPPTGGGARSWLFTAGVALVALVALLAVIFGTGGAEDGPVAAEGINGLSFVAEDGSESNLAEFGGQPLVVNFFASWCAPCRAELPDFQAVHVASEGRVQFVGISHDLDETSWRSFVAETDVTYPTVFQPDMEIFETLDLLGMPSTVLINPDGDVVHRVSGVLNEAALRDAIAEHLSVEI